MEVEYRGVSKQGSTDPRCASQLQVYVGIGLECSEHIPKELVSIPLSSSFPFSTLLVTKFNMLPDHVIKRCGSALLPVEEKVLVKRNQRLEPADIYKM